MKKIKICGRPTGFNFSHPLYRKQNFVYGQTYDSNPVELTNFGCTFQTRSGRPLTWASSSVSSVPEFTAASVPTSVKSSHSASTSGTMPSSRLVKYTGHQVPTFFLFFSYCCSCTVMEISTGLRTLNKGYVWPLDILAEGPDSLLEFPK